MIAANQGEPLSGRKSQAEEEYRNICRRLLGEEVPFMEICSKKRHASAGLETDFHENRFHDLQKKEGIHVENRFSQVKRPLRRICQKQNENFFWCQNGSTALRK